MNYSFRNGLVENRKLLFKNSVNLLLFSFYFNSNIYIYILISFHSFSFYTIKHTLNKDVPLIGFDSYNYDTKDCSFFLLYLSPFSSLSFFLFLYFYLKITLIIVPLHHSFIYKSAFICYCTYKDRPFNE